MKDSIRLNCRISKNKQLKILEEHYDGTLDSILFPTLSGDGKDTDLHIDKPVYAIHLADVREL